MRHRQVPVSGLESLNEEEKGAVSQLVPKLSAGVLQQVVNAIEEYRSQTRASALLANLLATEATKVMREAKNDHLNAETTQRRLDRALNKTAEGFLKFNYIVGGGRNAP